MRIALKVGAFALGLAAATAVLVGLSIWAPGAWLPIALCFVLGALLANEPWVRKRGLAPPLFLALLFGMSAGWLASSGETMRITPAMRLASTAGSAVAGLCALVAVAQIVRLPAKLRSAGAWLCVPVVMTWTMSVASSSVAGSGHMVHWFMAHFHWSEDVATTVVHWMRKTIHVSWYGFLAFSARTAAVFGGEKAALAARFGLSYGVAVASFDELRQASQPGRNGSFYDVLLDTSGMLAFLLIAHLFASGRRSGRTLSS